MIKRYRHRVETHSGVTDQQVASLLDTRREEGWEFLSLSVWGTSITFVFRTWEKARKR